MQDNQLLVIFQINKAGTISTDLVLLGSRDLIPYRVGIFAFVSLVMVTAYSGFDFFYEAIRHVPGPHFHAVFLYIKKDLVK
jgi:hypothetical protein